MDLACPRWLKTVSLGLILHAGTGYLAGVAEAALPPGFTSGSFSVNAGGAAIFTLPIRVPGGTAGLAPEIAVSYSSQGDNGALGVGGRLSGVSSIERCPRTLEQDGEIHGINHTAADRFCLNGERLVAIAGRYGADGTEYRLERDNHSRIISYGAIDYGDGTTAPAYFRVWDREGGITNFGNTEDSRVPAPGSSVPHRWLINRAEDRAGNYVTYGYTEVSDEQCLVDRIDYGGNDRAGTAPSRTIRFDYEPRPDRLEIRLAGSTFANTVRLAGIRTFSDGLPLRSYRFGYEQSPTTGRSRLVTLAECDADTRCRDTYALSWQDSETGATTLHAAREQKGLTWPGSETRTFAVEINGDGRKDLLQIKKGRNRYRTYVADADGGYTVAHEGYDGVQRMEWRHKLTGDWNGDGLTDLAEVAWETDRLDVFLADGKGRFIEAWDSVIGYLWNAQKSATLVGEFNGDGRDDMLQILAGWHRVQVALSRGDGTFEKTFRRSGTAASDVFIRSDQADSYAADLNGDGLTDVLQVRRDRSAYRTVFSSGDGRFHRQYGTHKTSLARSAEAALVLGDWNGDGITDVAQVQRNSDALETFVSTGDGRLEPVQSSGELVWRAKNARTYATDFDGDGRDDLLQIHREAERSRLLRSNGDGSFTLAWNGIGDDVPTRLRDVDATIIADVDGDGLGDVTQVWHSGSRLRTLTSRGPRPDLLTRITDAAGIGTSIEYAAMTDSAVYTRGHDAAYPERDMQRSTPLVAAYERPDGAGGAHRFTYRYGGAREHLRGRGRLGFRWREVTDSRTGSRTTVRVRQDWPFTGMHQHTVTALAGG